MFGVLFVKPGYRDEMDRLQKLMDHLKEQERGYTGLLQTLLVSFYIFLCQFYVICV
jgi:hypothetical protein